MKTPGTVTYAMAGAGWFGQEAVLPAFANAKKSKLAAIISGDPGKRAELSRKYSVPAFAYADLDRALDLVDALYIVTPNTEHRELAEAAARRGVHVLCEKPLAETSASAQAMVDACQAANVKLMTAYRLHFEKANLTAVEYIHAGKIGEPRLFRAVNTQLVTDAANIRLDPHRGGHPLLDLGVYCLNAARYLFRAEPIDVVGFEAGVTNGVPDLVTAVLRFPGERLAEFSCGFGQAKASHFQVIGTRGDVMLDPAFSFTGDKVLTLTIDEASSKETYRTGDQMAAEIEYFSECILNDTPPEPDGREGLADLKIMDAIRMSIREGRVVPLLEGPDRQRPGLDQAKKKRAPKKPKLVNATSPTAD